MKIILSRKGFDAKNGGVPSPVFSDGSLLSLPIPVQAAPKRFADLRYWGGAVGDLVTDLTQGAVPAMHPTHADPDLVDTSMRRKARWKPAFGQSGAAQTHLAGCGVGKGDLFLFFGWFRQVVQTKAGWRYERNAPHRHVIFGWLQVGEVLPVGSNTEGYHRSHPWLADHPHLHGPQSHSNTVYVARDKLDLLSRSEEIPGGGVFTHMRAGLTLTAQHQANRSLWELPSLFAPAGKTPLTYHAAPSRWNISPNGTLLLQSAAIGQEFVLDTKEYPEAMLWAADLISRR